MAAICQFQKLREVARWPVQNNETGRNGVLIDTPEIEDVDGNIAEARRGPTAWRDASFESIFPQDGGRRSATSAGASGRLRSGTGKRHERY